MNRKENCLPNIIPINSGVLPILQDEMTKYGAEFYRR